MDAYVKQFHEKELDCCDLVTKDVLLDVCLHGTYSIVSVANLREGKSGGRGVNKVSKNLKIFFKFSLSKYCMHKIHKKIK